MSRTKKFRCAKCKCITEELYSLTEYGMRAFNSKDDKEYCERCFTLKFGDNNEKSNDEE